MVAARLVQACDEMGAARTGGAAADAEPAGEFGLPGGGKCSAFLVAYADPFDLAVAWRKALVGAEPRSVRS
jgi:hypothetical protein